MAGANGLAASIDQAVLPKSARGATVVPDMLNEAAATYLQQATNRVARLGDVVWEDTRNSLLEGFRAGESIDQLSTRVRNEAQFGEARARAVARTETIMASNGGAWAQAQSQPDVLKPKTKRWSSTKDGRTRLSHRTANGQTQPLDTPFHVGGASLRFPCDPLGPAVEVVNCRCSVLYDVEDVEVECPDTMTMAEARRRQFEANVREYLSPLDQTPDKEIDAMVRAFHNIDDKFPGLIDPKNLSIKYEGFMDISTVADVDTYTMNPIRANIRISSARAKAGKPPYNGSIDEEWADRVADGWWPNIRPEAQGWEATMTHELAHSICFDAEHAWQEGYVAGTRDTQWNPFDLIAQKLGRDRIGTPASRSRIGTILGTPSRYGIERSGNEWLAESFIDALLGVDPKPESLALIEVLQEVLAEYVAAAAVGATA